MSARPPAASQSPFPSQWILSQCGLKAKITLEIKPPAGWIEKISATFYTPCFLSSLLLQNWFWKPEKYGIPSFWPKIRRDFKNRSHFQVVLLPSDGLEGPQLPDLGRFLGYA